MVPGYMQKENQAASTQMSAYLAKTMPYIYFFNLKMKTKQNKKPHLNSEI